MGEYMGIYELTSLNLTGLGGPMGTERVTTNWRRFYASFEDAKIAAQKDYTRGEIHWHHKAGGYCSGDLGYVAYAISEIYTEKSDEK